MPKPFILDMEIGLTNRTLDMTNSILEPKFTLNSMKKGRHIPDTGHSSSTPTALENETGLSSTGDIPTRRQEVSGASRSLSKAPKAKGITAQ